MVQGQEQKQGDLTRGVIAVVLTRDGGVGGRWWEWRWREVDALETHFMVQLTGLPDELEVRDQGNKGTPEVLLETLLGLGSHLVFCFLGQCFPVVVMSWLTQKTIFVLKCSQEGLASGAPATPGPSVHCEHCLSEPVTHSRPFTHWEGLLPGGRSFQLEPSVCCRGRDGNQAVGSAVSVLRTTALPQAWEIEEFNIL